MAEKEKLKCVRFWIGEKLKKEIDEFAHGFTLSSADLYKAGAILLMNMMKSPPEINLNLFTRSFKDLENSQIRKKALKSYKESRNVY